MTIVMHTDRRLLHGDYEYRGNRVIVTEVNNVALLHRMIGDGKFTLAIDVSANKIERNLDFKWDRRLIKNINFYMSGVERKDKDTEYYTVTDGTLNASNMLSEIDFEYNMFRTGDLVVKSLVASDDTTITEYLSIMGVILDSTTNLALRYSRLGDIDKFENTIDGYTHIYLPQYFKIGTINDLYDFLLEEQDLVGLELKEVVAVRVDIGNDNFQYINNPIDFCRGGGEPSIYDLESEEIKMEESLSLVGP